MVTGAFSVIVSGSVSSGGLLGATAVRPGVASSSSAVDPLGSVGECSWMMSSHGASGVASTSTGSIVGSVARLAAAVISAAGLSSLPVGTSYGLTVTGVLGSSTTHAAIVISVKLSEVSGSST